MASVLLPCCQSDRSSLGNQSCPCRAGRFETKPGQRFSSLHEQILAGFRSVQIRTATSLFSPLQTIAGRNPRQTGQLGLYRHLATSRARTSALGNRPLAGGPRKAGGTQAAPVDATISSQTCGSSGRSMMPSPSAETSPSPAAKPAAAASAAAAAAAAASSFSSAARATAASTIT